MGVSLRIVALACLARVHHRPALHVPEEQHPDPGPLSRSSAQVLLAFCALLQQGGRNTKI